MSMIFSIEDDMPKKKQPTTAARITAAREAAGLNKQQLAKASGLDHRHIGQLEAGFCEPKLKTLRALAVGLGIDWRDLIAD